MILSDRENKLAQHRDHIRIAPPPPDSAISSTSVDLTLHEEITIWTLQQDGRESPVVAYPARPNFDVREFLRQYGNALLLSSEGFILKPGAFVLGWTEERIRLPHASRLAARVEGRSSMARLGVGIHVTAPTIHSGFGETADPQYPGTRIQLEIWNCGPFHVCLEKGMKICQLLLEEVHGTPEKGYAGAFAMQAPANVSPPQPKPGTRKRRQR
jgi:dCTP deaminase